jgi:hypothetical protein
MLIELALNGLPRLLDGRVRPELSIARFTDANERGAFRDDSQGAFPMPQVSHSHGHVATLWIFKSHHSRPQGIDKVLGLQLTIPLA